MIYLDTSVAVPLFVAEPASERVDAWLDACGEGIVSSDWIVTEFASALSIKERSGTLSARDATAAWRSFEAFSRSGLRLAPVNRTAFAEAARIIRQAAFGLRSGDAVHLAVAREIGVSAIATLDATMASSAKRLKMKTVAFS